MLCALCDLCVQRDSFTSSKGLRYRNERHHRRPTSVAQASERVNKSRTTQKTAEPAEKKCLRSFCVFCVQRRISSKALQACRDEASTKASKSGRNSPVRQKFSGCHWTPRQNRAAGSSIASMTPSGAVADTLNPRATSLTA